MKRFAVILLAVVLLVSACGSKKLPAGPAIAPEPPARSYVAIGASESVGIGADSPLREAWTKLFWANALPAGTVLTDVATSGSTISQAVSKQLPLALAAKPNYVTVWLNVNDILAGVSTADYQKSLNELLSTLKSQTSARVLVANVPPLDQLPAYVAARSGDIPRGSAFSGKNVLDPTALDATVDAYNAAIASSVAANGDTLVDLHALGLSQQANGFASSFISSDGFHPSTAGHAAVANAFEQAFK